jgi:hypothetical protein
MNDIRKVSLSIFIISFLLLITLAYAMHVDGISLDYYTGERVDGNVTIIPVENPQNKTKKSFTNGEWSVDFDMITDDVEYVTFITDANGKIGYTQVRLGNNPPRKELQCSVQNISIYGYSAYVDTGTSVTSGSVTVSILDTDYTNTKSFSGEWSIDFHPCLISGKIFILHILVSDYNGNKGEYFQSYPAR